MPKRSKLFYTRLVALFAILVFLLAVGYVLQLKKVIEKNIINSVTEIALHDKRAIKTCIEFFLEDLRGVAKRLVSYQCQSTEAMQIRLNLESSSSEFTHIYMLAEDGKVYTDKLVVYDPAQYNLGARIDLLPFFADDNVRQVVTRFDDKAEFAGISRESILYGIRMDDYEVSGIRMKALFGITDIHFIQDHMIIDSFIMNGTPHGYSSVIDLKGHYIIGRTRDVYQDNSSNFFDDLEAGRSSELDPETVAENMRRSETFSFYADNGENYLIYLVPFDDEIDWYFITLIKRDVLIQQQTTFALMSLVLLVVVVAILMGLMLYGMSNHNKLFKAREAVKVRSEFLSSMSHEIRTPLNGLIGLNHLISTHIEEQSRIQQIKDWLDKSKNLANYLLSLLNDILDMSKLQAGKIDIITAPFYVESMIDDIYFMQKDNIEKKGIEFNIEKKILAPCIKGDEIRTKQVLVNIVGNAAKFTRQGGYITLSVSQRKEADGRVTTIYRCKDSGIGMSPAFVEKIFDPFSQERTGDSDNTLKGTGLGMPITKQLVDAMGGTVHVESALGQGSTFTISIPSVVVEGNPAALHSAEAASPAEQTPRRHDGAPIKILLAEDAEFNAEFLLELLTDEGFEVVHAENGQVALDTFKESATDEFDIILMDMQMPVMDGCQATEAIRKLDRPDAATVLIFACTANTFKADMDKALQSGMNDFLIKPIDIKALLKKLRQKGFSETMHPGR